MHGRFFLSYSTNSWSFIKRFVLPLIRKVKIFFTFIVIIVCIHQSLYKICDSALFGKFRPSIIVFQYLNLSYFSSKRIIKLLFYCTKCMRQSNNHAFTIITLHFNKTINQTCLVKPLSHTFLNRMTHSVVLLETMYGRYYYLPVVSRAYIDDVCWNQRVLVGTRGRGQASDADFGCHVSF